MIDIRLNSDDDALAEALNLQIGAKNQKNKHIETTQFKSNKGDRRTSVGKKASRTSLLRAAFITSGRPLSGWKGWRSLFSTCYDIKNR